ncbi:acyl-CoA thioester hydrolase/BAAT C-terminal domain-containing protein [Phenylobacterium sp.]|uniref:acyl-CoA thioester hydrolase/BAAT C-terminal domain-containing protein n=1 Tax=Phenylobacterium sp. TaxID=1871053 RepID=UPI003BABF4D4
MNSDRRSLLRRATGLGLSLAASRSAAATVSVLEVRARGLVGRFYTLPGARRRPGVLMLNGSDGGLPAEKDALDLAASGYPTLALAYFKNWSGQPAGLPDSLNEIPLEYLFRGLEWLRARREVGPVAVMGLSRGGELALLLGALRPDVAGVIAFSPSSRVWSGLPPRSGPPSAPKPAWTLKGRPVAFQVAAAAAGTSMRRWFEQARPLDAAVIPVERIRGPVLLVSSRADTIWPAAVYADEIEARLRSRNFRHSVTNLQFDKASHLLMGPGPGLTTMEIPGGGFSFAFGGDAQGTERARDAGWTAAKSLLDGLDPQTRRR